MQFQQCSLGLVLFLSLSSVYAEINQVLIYSDNSKDIKALEKSKKYEFQAASAIVNNSEKTAIELKIRGQTCQGAKRKCFGMKSKDKQIKFPVYLPDGSIWKTGNIMLPSMYEDKGYVSNRIGHSLGNRIGVSPLKNTYTELYFNGQYRGIYLAIQKPEKVADKSPWVGRRRTGNSMETETCDEKIVSPATYCTGKDLSSKDDDGEYFITQYYQMLDLIKKYESDSSLLGKLEERMDLEGYMRLLTLQSLLKNADYDDELYVYADAEKWMSGNKVYFRFIPWDLEDLFGEPYDSKANKDAAADGLFRSSILYSFSDIIDHAIGVNRTLTQKLNQVAKTLLESELTEAMIKDAIEEVRSDLAPYLARSEAFKMMMLDPVGEDGQFRRPDDIVGERGILNQRYTQLLQRRAELLRRL